MKEFEIQKKFAEACRTGNLNLLNVDRERLKLYTEIISMNVNDTLINAFPILNTILPTEIWEKLVKNFMKEQLKTPYLWQLPEEFMNFILNSNWKNILNIPFLKDLLIYEWLELELFYKKDISSKKEFDWNDYYQFNETTTIVNFEFPIHNISKYDFDEIVNKKGSYPMILYRNIENNEIEYIEITPFLYEILNKIKEGLTPIESLEEISYKYNVDYNDILDVVEKFLKKLIDRKIII